MKNLEIILSVASTALAFLITALTFLMKFLKSAKAKRIAEEIISIGNAVVPYIKQAESFVNYSGREKKEYVMTKANQFAIEKGLCFNTELVSEKIEELVGLTKSVNMRDKDKLCAAVSANASEYAQCMQYQEERKFRPQE